MANGQESWKEPRAWVSPVIAVGLLILFTYVAVQVTSTSNDPPRRPTRRQQRRPRFPPGGEDYPPQYRGGYDPNARLLALLAIVSPLLTTIVGFYFGQRAGEASSRAVQAQAEQEKSQIASVAATMAQRNASASQVLDELAGRGLIRR
jgi:uncharacterized protein HemX